MGLDGIFLSALLEDLNLFVGARIEKIWQPSNYEIAICLKRKKQTKTLLISANSENPIIYFTKKSYLGLEKNLYFLDLLKSRLNSAFLSDVFQQGLDRILYLKFACKDQIYEKKDYILCVELIPRYSNIILYDENSLKIEDSIKRISLDSFKTRPILPKFKFSRLVSQKKLNIKEYDSLFIAKKILEFKDMTLNKALVCCLQGLSPFVAGILSARLRGCLIRKFKDEDKSFVFKIISWLKNIVEGKKYEFFVIIEDGRVKEYTFFDPLKFSDVKAYRLKKFENVGEMLDYFYEDRAYFIGQTKKENSLTKLLNREISKIIKKIEVFKKDLENADLKKEYKKYGDLLAANIYKMKKGASSIEVENFYDEGKPLNLNLNPNFSPQKNVQNYYKLFKKAKAAKQKLPELLNEAKKELNFLQCELGFVNRASSFKDLFEIALELKERKYNFDSFIKNKNYKPKKDSFLKFCSSDGFYFYAGKNNTQNEMLTLRKAKKEDLWFHVGDLFGSHVVMFTNGKTPSNSAIFEAATVASYYSNARNEKKVLVWYTLIKNVSKGKGQPLGSVIFKKCDSISVSPNFEVVKNLEDNYKKSLEKENENL